MPKQYDTHTQQWEQCEEPKAALNWIDFATPGDKIVCKDDGRHCQGLHRHHVYTILRKYQSDGQTYVALKGICEGEDLPGWFPERFVPLAMWKAMQAREAA